MKSHLRLLSIASSYVVGMNRRLVNEMALAGGDRWEITAVSPKYCAGRNDLGPNQFEPSVDDQCAIVPARLHLNSRIHISFYGRELRNLFDHPWSLVHCWQEPYTLPCAQAAWLTPRQTPFVFWTAQSISKRYPPPFSWMERYCLGRCAGWLGCGHTTLQVMLARGYGVKPYRIIPLGVAVDHFRPNQAARAEVRHTLGWDESGAPVIGFLGRFVPEKGLQLLTKVLDDLPTLWRALFVGAGPLENWLREWAHPHGPRVRIISRVPHDAVPRYLNAMDILCAPSQTTPAAREQMGRMIIEAWACRVPVIGSDCGEIPHVIGDAGVVLPEKDKPAWVAALAQLLESPARRASLGERGLTKARDEYAWPVIAHKHLAFFEKVILDM